MTVSKSISPSHCGSTCRGGEGLRWNSTRRHLLFGDTERGLDDQNKGMRSSFGAAFSNLLPNCIPETFMDEQLGCPSIPAYRKAEKQSARQIRTTLAKGGATIMSIRKYPPLVKKGDHTGACCGCCILS